MKRSIGIFLIMIATYSFIQAQNNVEVLRYSRTNVVGSARVMAHGGAFGAVGADFSVLSINPAGIGLYKKSEFVVTPSLYLSNLKSDLNGHGGSAQKENFNMANYGLVLSSPINGNNEWKHFQFGIGVNRIANFNQDYYITNENQRSSLITDYQGQAYGKHPEDLDPFSTDLAWYHYLLEDTVRLPNGQLDYTSPLEFGGVYQQLRKSTWGSINEMNISFGGNYGDKVYIGGGVGFPFLRYYEESAYLEEDRADTIANFYKFIKDDYLETHGNGVNFKLGVILRPTGWIRFGLAFHSPTYYSMNDLYSSSMTRYYDDGTKDYTNSPEGKFDYNLTTPMKLIGSTALTIGRFLLVSADAEYINYSNGRLDASYYRFTEENEQVESKYKSTLNLKMGAELRLRPLSFRAGLNYLGSPYVDDINDGQVWKASAGIGYRDRQFFIDFAYVYTIKNENYYLYNPELIDPANLEMYTHQIAMSVGFKF